MGSVMMMHLDRVGEHPYLFWTAMRSWVHALLRHRFVHYSEGRMLESHTAVSDLKFWHHSVLYFSVIRAWDTQRRHPWLLTSLLLIYSFCVLNDLSWELVWVHSYIFLHISSSWIYSRQYSLGEGKRSFTGNAKSTFYKVEIGETMSLVT